MRWLIDGYNVIRRDPDLQARESESLQAGRTALLRVVAEAARRSGDEFTVVFDGARISGGPASGGRVRVLFSRPPQTADDVLIRLASEWREGAAVVTSDRTVGNAARRAGAAVVTSDQFLMALDTARGPDVDADTEEEAAEGEPLGACRRGNPRRRSREARATARALRRLRP